MKYIFLSHAEICPICRGKGRLEKNEVCHGCGGKGWITVDNPPVPFYEN